MNEIALITQDAQEVTAVVKHPLALDLPKGLSFEEWWAVGKDLATGERQLRWWVGDWWAYGQHNYGDRLKTIKEAKWSGFQLSFSSCVRAGSVSRSIESARRRALLTWSHHQEVAAL